MTDRINKKTIGIFAINASILLWLTDRLTHFFSTLLGKIIYGDHYIYTSDGKISDPSYGFTIDMYLAYSLFTVFLLGILFYYSSLKETTEDKNTIQNN